jgi:SNF2 family DNA or RNA helicase
MIIFANWSSSLSLLTDALQEAQMTDYVFVHGGITGAKHRDILYTRFRTNEDVHQLLMTMKLGATVSCYLF